MKKLSNATIIAVIVALLIATAVFALVGNGDFETGDFTGWVKGAFINNGFSAAHGGGGLDLSVIVGGPAVVPLSLSDPHTSGVLKYPAYGHYSARVNSDASYTGGGFAQNANVITQNVTAFLDPGDSQAHIRFSYAAVMVNPLSSVHTAEQKPYFRVRAINTSNGNDVLYDFDSYVGEPGKNWQTGMVFSGIDNWQYLDWNYIDLASSVAHPVSAGDIITLEITAAGCSLGGHPGYVYLDEITDGVIAGPSIQATGPATVNTGATITYTYNYFNGSGGSVNRTITATQPTGVTFTSVSDVTNCSLSSGIVTCNYTGIGAGTGGSFTINGIVTAAGGSQIAHGDYGITATGFPTLGGKTVLTSVAFATLTLTASGPATVLPGGQYTYTFNYTTTASISNTQVGFTLPGHTTFASNSGGYTCTPSSGVVTCDLGTVAANGSFDVTVAVDKLKKVNTPLTLETTAYSISASGVLAVNGATTVTANTLTPFMDVPAGYWALDYIQSIWAYGITYGCAAASPLTVYCPDLAATRGEMSVFIERAVHTSAFNPGTPAITFTDTSSHFARYWIEALKSDGLTGGCGTGTTFCPDSSITRIEMSIFLLRGQSWPAAHVPPESTGMWLDMPATHWGVNWADELGTSGITSGCGGGNFCPSNAVLRSEMAVLIQRTFHMSMPTP